ncbi:TatD family hydrolase, partial [Acinetobacter baumannii]
YVSFSGIVTYKSAPELRRIAALLPADRILVETDAPYLAPGKYRGKTNEPSFVVETGKVVAEARGVAPEDWARQTTDNFYRLFAKADRG